MQFELYHKDGRFYFRLVDDEKAVLHSKPYRSRRSCLRAIGLLKGYALDRGRYERKHAQAGHTFTIRAKNNRIMARSVVFASKSVCLKKIERINRIPNQLTVTRLDGS